MKRIQLAIVAAGLLATAGGLYLVFASDHEETPLFTAAVNLVVVWAFIITGVVAWSRRPDNSFGVLMAAVGLTWILGALNESNSSIPFSLGMVLGGIGIAVFIHALLAFPRGYLQTKLVVAAVAAAYGIMTVAQLVYALFEAETCDECPENAFLVTDSEAAVTALVVVVAALGIFVLGATIAVLVRRWRAASAPLRRILAPVYTTAGATLLVLAVGVVVSTFSERAADVLNWILLFTFASVPLAFLAGLLRTRLARAGVGGLVVELGRTKAPGELREGAMRRSLGDPTLRLARYAPETGGFVDIEGRPLELPGEDDEERVATMIERKGRPVGALVHDKSLRDDPTALDAVAAAVGLALENEQRLAELTVSEGRNRALIDGMPDLMFRMRGDGTYLDVKGDRRALVADPEELIGRNVFDVLPPELADHVMGAVRRALEQGTLQTVEYRLTLADGPRDFEARNVVSGEDEVVVVVRDITERKQAEEELERLHVELQARHQDLERERDFIRTVVDSAPSLFCLVTPGGFIVRFNQTLERLSGRADSDLVRGHPFWEVFIAPEERDEVRREFERVSADQASGEHENRWISESGERRLIAWSTTPLADERGASRYLISGMDVTERKRQEEELRRSRARIVEAGDVERRRLERNLHDGAQQRLVSLSLALRLAQSKLDGDAAEAGRLLGAASDELTQALQELRELARGIHPAVLTDRGLGPALEALAGRAPLPVQLALTDDALPPPVEAAAYYVVSEALANVARYAEASAVQVRVERSDGRAVVEVADDGVGGADPSQGSGLRGLADRVEALDGRLVIESSPGAGTRIRAEFPCA
jgi:PAS domain S-box-containing protein